MPVFNDNLHEKDVHGKSWALYETMQAGEELLVRLTIDTGQNFSISVNMAGSQAFEVGTDYVNVSVRGHNASAIKCDPLFNGWRVLSGTHASGVEDQTKIIPTTTADEPLHFEIFGVGYYRKLAACQGKVPVGDVFNVSVTALKDAQISVGVGMAESFSFTDIILMSIWIVQTWFWDGYFVPWVVSTVAIAVILIFTYSELLRKAFVSCGGSISFFTSYEAETAVVRSILFFNAMQFLIRLIIINSTASMKSVDFSLAIPIGVHILLPLAVAVAWGNLQHTQIAFGVLLVYSSTLLWSGFFIIPAFCVYKIILRF
jgi:hypothetical protein